MIEKSYRGWVKERERHGINGKPTPNKGLQYRGISLRSLYTDLPTEQKSSCLKGTYTIMKEIHLLTLKRLPNEQRISETVSVV